MFLRSAFLLCFFATPIHRAVAAADAVAADQEYLNIFVAFDKEKYMAEALASMRQAYHVPRDRRGGRKYKWFVLHAGEITSQQICAAAQTVHASRDAARAEFEGCAAFDANRSDGCRADTARYAATKTVNTIRFAEPSPALREIFQLSKVAYDLPGFCRSRPGLLNYMNFAPDAVDEFLLPLGVRRVALLDADAAPNVLFPRFYDSGDAVVAALSRHQSDCRAYFEKFNVDHPYVAATLGASVEAVNRRRFRADALVVNDLERYCDIDVKRGVANALRVQVTYPRDESKRLWRCGLQQPPLVLAAANHTRVLRYYDLAPVDDEVEVCGAAPAAWTTKKNGVTYACRVLGFERDRPGCVDRLLARMRATAPGDHHTPGCGLFNKQRHRRPPPA